MRTYLLFFLFVLCVGLVGSANAQISNLIIVNSDTTFTMVSGSQISWSFNIPNGASTAIEIWLDVNGNGAIDTSVDKQRVSFEETDGDTNGNNGPSDMDGLVNGHVEFAFDLGFAPGNWIMQFSQGGTTLTRHGTITPLTSPAHTISGYVTAPSGKSPRYVFVQLNRNEEHQPNFWEAITDSSGYYAIKMNADTAGNPWRVRMADHYNPFPPNVCSPTDYEVTITGNHSGFDFSFVSSAAKVVGYLKDENGTAISGVNVSLHGMNSSNFNRESNTDGSGYFEIGLSVSELSNDDFNLQSSFDENNSTPSYIAAQKVIHGIHNTDSLFYDLVAYSVNSTIQGTVRVNGNPPGMSMQVSGSVQDSGYTSTHIDSATGNFSLPVSNKLYNYNLWVNNLGPNYFITNVTAHPGETGVIINITVTGVLEREPGIPSQFTLHQNYPNPFNPTTTIDYDLPTANYVSLKVYNVLGNEVMSLINQEQEPGKYRATIDASALPSGIYFCHLNAGTFSGMKKMILTK